MHNCGTAKVGIWGQGAQTRSISVQKKRENHKNRTHSKIKLYIIFFFSMIDINFFTNGGQGGSGGTFFLHITVLFHPCIIKTLYISSFNVVFVIYILHTVNIVVL